MWAGLGGVSGLTSKRQRANGFLSKPHEFAGWLTTDSSSCSHLRLGASFSLGEDWLSSVQVVAVGILLREGL